MLKLFDKTAAYVTPRRRSRSSAWNELGSSRGLKIPLFLKKYFIRNLSEAGFSADKRRFSWAVRQRGEDRQEFAMFSIALLHNSFAIRVKPK